MPEDDPQPAADRAFGPLAEKLHSAPPSHEVADTDTTPGTDAGYMRGPGVFPAATTIETPRPRANSMRRSRNAFSSSVPVTPEIDRLMTLTSACCMHT